MDEIWHFTTLQKLFLGQTPWKLFILNKTPWKYPIFKMTMYRNVHFYFIQDLPGRTGNLLKCHSATK